MKNNILFMLIAGSLALFSCGTANRSTYASSEFVNGIYYVPSKNQEQAYLKSNSELDNLKNETVQYLDNRSKGINYASQKENQVIYVGDTNVVNIAYNPNYTYTIVDDSLSYMERMNKYIYPSYNINIELDMPYSAWYDSWYQPAWVSWGTAWYNPYWGTFYSWWAPSYSWHRWHGWYGYYDPWGWHGPWYDWYHDPWYGYPGNYPWYPGGPGLGPVAPGHPHRDVYYGQRNSSPSYKTQTGSIANRGGSYARKEANMNQIRGNRDNRNTQYTANGINTKNPGYTPQQASPANRGSSYRRNGNSVHNGAVYNNNIANSGINNNQSALNQQGGSSKPATSNSGSMYRRSSQQYQGGKPATSNNKSTYSNGYRTNNSNAYRTSSAGSSYNRSGSSYSNSSRSVSSGNNSATSTRSGGSSTRSGGSSYRR